MNEINDIKKGRELAIDSLLVTCNKDAFKSCGENAMRQLQKRYGKRPGDAAGSSTTKIRAISTRKMPAVKKSNLPFWGAITGGVIPVAAAIIFFSFIKPMLSAMPGNPFIKEALNEVYIIRGEQKIAASLGEKLKVGDEVFVSNDSQALISYDDNSIILMHEDSLLAFSHVGLAKWAEIKRGATYFEVSPQVKDTPFQVLTPNCQIEVLGTSFDLVHREQKTNLEMKTGVVRLQDLVNNRVDLVKRGQSVEINASKKAVLKPNVIKKIWQPDGRITQDIVGLFHFSNHENLTLINYVDENSLLLGNQNVGKYTFGFDGVRLEGDSVFINPNAENLFNQVGESKEISVELWLKPGKEEDSAHTGIVFSMGEKNESAMTAQKWFFALEEVLTGYSLYMRSSEQEVKITDIEISPDLFYETQHLIISMNAKGQIEIFLNKEKVYSVESKIDLSFWKNHKKAFYQIGGATSVGHKWEGKVFALAIYKRALNEQEITQNYLQGFKF